MKLFLGSLADYFFNELITHIPMHPLRKAYLRILNRNIHSSSTILMHTRILHIWNIKIGERVVINQFCLLDCRKYSIKIGNDTDIGPYTRIWTLGHDPDDVDHKVKGADTIIEDHVWIASGVTILPGTKIGRGAVVSAGSVVTKNLESLSVSAGNPAKIIRQRNNPLIYTLSYTPCLD
jgi:putative colanic acid biosynthesis acetyltransferase WcaF